MMELQMNSYEGCTLCPRQCNVNRTGGAVGVCGMDSQLRVARAALHLWEEPCISGSKGSGTVFFTGCNLHCIYCQNYEIASSNRGEVISVEHLKDIFLRLQQEGAANINLVTPDHYLPGIIKALQLAREQGLWIPIVYNGSGYERPEIIRSLKGWIDIFLTDFKYMETELAAEFSRAPDYPEVAKKALKEMVSITGVPQFNDQGMMQRGVIVRHLLLPGHRRNAKSVLHYLAETYGDRIYISIMNQYTPTLRIKEQQEYPELKRKVTKREYEDLLQYACDLNITQAFIQEGDTARESFIPSFYDEGV